MQSPYISPSFVLKTHTKCKGCTTNGIGEQGDGWKDALCLPCIQGLHESMSETRQNCEVTERMTHLPKASHMYGKSSKREISRGSRDDILLIVQTVMVEMACTHSL